MPNEWTYDVPSYKVMRDAYDALEEAMRQILALADTADEEDRRSIADVLHGYAEQIEIHARHLLPQENDGTASKSRD